MNRAIRTIGFLALVALALSAIILAGSDRPDPDDSGIVHTDAGGVEPLPSPETPTDRPTIVNENPNEVYDPCNRTCN